MKSDLKVKYLQYLNNKKASAGFTLIELLVVIIIIGILSAIALPAFLNQANKAKQSEAKTNVGSMNRAQQAYILENDDFVVNTVADPTEFAKLGLGIATETANYKYGAIQTTGGGAIKGVTNFADTVDPDASLKVYYGQTVIGTLTDTGEATTLVVLCEALKPQVDAGGPTDPKKLNAASPPVCDAAGFKDLGD